MGDDRQTVTVEDYSRSFVRKMITEENCTDEELQQAGKTFYSLLRRLAKDGDREDVRVPFKILKDEFGEEWRSAAKSRQDHLVQRLFKVLDYVHDECQANLNHSLQGNAISEKILEEFRLRIAKMVTGETWSDILPMRLAGLKRMYKYMEQEMEFMTKYSSGNLDHRIPDKPKISAMGKFVRGLTGPAKNSWSAVFDDLFLTSGAKLAPLLFSLLDENKSLSAALDFDGGKEHQAKESSKQSSTGGSELEKADSHSTQGKKTEDGSNLIDFDEGQFPRENGSQLQSVGTEEEFTGLAKVQAALERITSLQSNQSSGEWVAFEEQSPRGGGSTTSRSAAGLETQWSGEGRPGVSRSGSMGHLKITRPPIPKSFSSMRGKDHFPGRSNPGSDSVPSSPRAGGSLKGVMFSRHFDNLDPLRKPVN
ncbi:hypothetical protein BSKO_13945 [Bryopsis sp. KO-2023]|nr:hypothetical protein BSKO_13945 [Bryopsis sp. KO-2023]